MFKNKKLSIFLLTVVIIISITSIGLTEQLEVHFIDVGQADSILIKLPNKEAMLIDAGNNADGVMVKNYLYKNNIKKVNYLVGTHPHEDHIGGLDDVITSFNIGNIYMPKVTHTSKTFEDVLLSVKNKDMNITAANRGMEIINRNSVKATILSPGRSDYEDLNNWSVVIKLDYKDVSFIFMGDAEDVVESELLSNNIDLNSDVLKVGHHGSNSSTTYPFLKAVSPEYAVISVGKDNSYGHPSPLVLNRLQSYGTNVLRTDEMETIIAISDGNSIEFNKVIQDPKPINQDNKEKDIKIINLDLKKEIVTIKNTSNSYILLSGWKLVSVKGNQKFIFPEETVLQPGKVINIISGRNAKEGPNTIKWTGSYIWNNEGDIAKLYNINGKLISSYN